MVDPRAVSSVTQGVTTEVIGNCGHGCAPIRDPASAGVTIYGYDPEPGASWRTMAQYLAAMEERRPAVNVASLVANGNLRLAATGVVDRPANARRACRHAATPRQKRSTRVELAIRPGSSTPWSGAVPRRRFKLFAR